MESTRFDYSTKNIPLPSESDYNRKLIEKTEHLCRRMRWKAHFYLNPDANGKQRETFGFNSKNTPPQVSAMLNFEKRLLSMIENIKFKKVKCWFQRKLSSDIQTNIKKSSDLLIPADKTSNFYKMDSTAYNGLLQKNITKTYKKVSPNTTTSIELEAKEIAKRLDLDDRVNTTAKREAFITLKDHKPNFVNNPTCRLINPAKSEIGKISKKILDRVNSTITNHLNLNQWKNTRAVLNWFNGIEHKEKFTFIAFDVVDFYPSISVDLLSEALQFASNYVNITDEEKHIILHAKKSLLYNMGEPWGKKASSDLFDVTMGSFDGAESCELVGAYLLHHIKEKYGYNFGLYRDDGLGVTQASPRQAEQIKKDLCNIFGMHGLKITIEANKKIVNFLDVTLNLSSGKHMPYNKPNNIPLYVNKKSNHPPRIIDNIPQSINRRLSEISYDEESFNKAAPTYQKALNNSGYTHQLTFSPQTPSQATCSGRKNRRREIIWYNPPYSKNVATNVGRAFLKILDEEFPKEHVLHKIFNRNTVKISYSCMSNLKQNIDGHNKSILHKKIVPPKTCNCRKPAECPMDGNCLKESVIYQATVTTEDNNPPQTYVGLTENSFKTRYSNHKTSLCNSNKRFSTELSKHIWHLRDNKVNFKVTWKILKQAAPYNPASNRCNLCLWEKYFIICKPELASLNKRNELITSCRHANKFLLKNAKF